MGRFGVFGSLFSIAACALLLFASRAGRGPSEVDRSAVNIASRAAGGRPSAAACAKKRASVGACSVRRNWYRSLNAAWMLPECCVK